MTSWADSWTIFVSWVLWQQCLENVCLQVCCPKSLFLISKREVSATGPFGKIPLCGKRPQLQKTPCPDTFRCAARWASLQVNACRDVFSSPPKDSEKLLISLCWCSWHSTIPASILLCLQT
ncbi:hypothetical protein FKM82_011534 [Ascaphus truei]